MKKTLSLLLLAALTRPAIAYDPYKDQPRPQESQQDPEKFSRPVTNTLKGADIKEYRDKLNAAKAVVFKNPSAEGSSRFKSQTDDIAANKFQAQGPLAHFTDAVQTQIVSKLPEAKNSSKNLVVDVSLDGKTVTVDSAKIADSKVSVPALQAPKPLERPTAAVAAGVSVPATPAPQMPSAKTVDVQNGKVVTSPPEAKTVGPSQNPSAKTMDEKTAASSQVGDAKTDVLPTVAHPELPQVAKDLAADAGGVVKEPAVLPALEQPVIPLSGASVLVVTSVQQPKQKDAPAVLEVRGPIQDFPPTLMTQIKKDLSATEQASLPKTGDVAVTMNVKSDKTITVTSVNPVGTNQKVETVDVKSQPQLVEAAKSIATYLGIEPKSTTAQPAVVTIALTNGGEISVKEITTDIKASQPTYQAEAKFSDLSLQVKGQILDKLSSFGAQSAIKDDAQVQFNFMIKSDGKRDVTQIALKSDATPTKTILLLDSKPTSQSPNPISVGLAPAVARVIQTGFGFDVGKFQVKDITPEGIVHVTGEKVVGAEPKNISLAFVNAPEVPDGLTAFSVEDKPLSFSDEIREAIYAKLKEAVQNGESWASDALKRNKNVDVELVVKDGDDKVEVKSVTQPAKDAAIDLAHNSGLKDGDFLVASLNGQTLIALNQGKSALIKIGEKTLKLNSPDGGAKIFLKQNRAKNDIAITLMLSRESLEQNKTAIVGLSGKDTLPELEQAMTKNPKQKNFVLKLDPSATLAEKVVIK